MKSQSQTAFESGRGNAGKFVLRGQALTAGLRLGEDVLSRQLVANSSFPSVDLPMQGSPIGPFPFPRPRPDWMG